MQRAAAALNGGYVMSADAADMMRALFAQRSARVQYGTLNGGNTMNLLFQIFFVCRLFNENGLIND